MKSTKKSFLMSLVSLMLCFAMLLGTTYAWFTDSVTSGVNKIVAGNLDIELYHKDKAITGVAEKVTETVKLFDDVALWEPGAYAYETFTIKNVGNLAFKYSMQINAYNATVYNNHSLDEVLKVKVVDTAPTSRQTYSDAVPLKGWSLGETEKPLYPENNKPANGASEKTFTVVVYWEPTDHDNDWNMNNGNQGKTLSVDLGINLVATQLQYESDSFGTDYDKTAAIDLPFIPMTKKLAETEELKIVVPEEAESSVKEASVPAAVANAVFEKVFTNDENSDKSLTLVLNVEKTGETKTETNTEINYAIDMNAVIKEIKNSEIITDDIKSIDELELTFTDFVEVQMKIDSGLSNVTVKHNDEDMTEAASKEDIPAEGQDPDGYFNYNTANGDLTLWTKTFSPFTVTGEKLITKATATITEKADTELALSSRKFLVYSSMSTYQPQDYPFDVTIEAVDENGEDVIAVTTSAGVEYYKLSITGNLRAANVDADPNVCLYACGDDISTVSFTKGLLNVSTELWGITIGSDSYPWGAQFIK